MTELEVYNDLKQRVKPYIGVMEQGVFSNYMIRYKVGLLKPSTIKSFFSKVGYKLVGDNWEKVWCNIHNLTA